METDAAIAVEKYVSEMLAPHDEALDAALAATERAGMPMIQVSPPEGKLLNLLARMQGARAVLEVGTLGGYSTIWLARGMAPGGRLTTLELEPERAAVARESIERAGISDVVDLRVGAALDSLEQLDREGAGPFDLTFIDADKVHTPDYFVWALDHSRQGSLIVADNVVRGGTLAERDSTDPAAQAQREFHRILATESRVSATTIQTIGAKGHDGFTVALVG
jgi:predicted O-methyltransferase YrrM